MTTTPQFSARRQAEPEALQELPDGQIDTSDIPEVLDWRGARCGIFCSAASATLGAIAERIPRQPASARDCGQAERARRDRANRHGSIASVWNEFESICSHACPPCQLAIRSVKIQ